MRFDLAFMLCCCKSFLGSEEDDGGTYYDILALERDASQDDIKRAYKRLSLQLHPDKLAQRGKTITEEDQANFTKMKEAYEILSDPHKRETYDAIGAKGMKWMDEPFSMDPQEMAHNFAKSSVLDRSKVFAIFVVIAIAILLLPILICLHVDGAFGDDASWMWTLTPLWIWNAFILFYHSRVIMMGPIHRPENIPEEEWVDPLPMLKRVVSLLRFLLIMAFEVLCALKIDAIINVGWPVVFIPLIAWEISTVFKKWPASQLRVVTVEDLEQALGKPFHEFSPTERDLIAKRYSVVPSATSPEFEAASKIKSRARHDLIVSCFRLSFTIILLAQLQYSMDWSWWIIFAPFWILSALLCCANFNQYVEVQQMAAEKDPSLFSDKEHDTGATTTATTAAAGTATPTTPTSATADVETGDAVKTASNEASTNYGSVGNNGDATPITPLTEEEKEELRAQVIHSSSKLCNKCCSQGFTLILMIMFISKLQGADFSSLWILSPFLFAASIILCCLGCAIFGITEVPIDDVEFDTANTAANSAAQPSNAAAPVGTHYAPPQTPSTDDENDDSTASQLPPPPSSSSEEDNQNKATATATSAPGPIDLLDSNFAPASQPTSDLHDLD